MKINSARILVWLPRIITILFALFLSLFALDVFSEKTDILETFLRFLVHLIPSFLIIILLILSWEREWVGAVFFTMLGIFRLITTNSKFPVPVELVIAAPLFLIGLLFFINWIRRIRKGKEVING